MACSLASRAVMEQAGRAPACSMAKDTPGVTDTGLRTRAGTWPMPHMCRCLGLLLLGPFWGRLLAPSPGRRESVLAVGDVPQEVGEWACCDDSGRGTSLNRLGQNGEEWGQDEVAVCGDRWAGGPGASQEQAFQRRGREHGPSRNWADRASPGYGLRSCWGKSPQAVLGMSTSPPWTGGWLLWDPAPDCPVGGGSGSCYPISQRGK